MQFSTILVAALTASLGSASVISTKLSQRDDTDSVAACETKVAAEQTACITACASTDAACYTNW